jgi:SAM-dependent methyltransferase
VEAAEIPANQQAWQQDTYEAWIQRYGTPSEVVAQLRRSPTTVLQPIYKYLGEVSGKRVANLMGSNGVKALALALLGAEVTLFDYSPGNTRYARDLAREAEVILPVVECDVLQIPPEQLQGNFDLVLAELGIVHYFTDLKPFMEVVHRLLATGGRFVLRDFHPVSTKLLSFRGTTAKIRKYKVTGDYFDTALEERAASYTKHLPATGSLQPATVFWRKWTLGEVVTAVASSGLFIRTLDEEPNLSSEVFDKGIPKTYSLVADKV